MKKITGQKGNKRWRWYAVIPVLFAMQQAVEGVQWLLPKPSLASTIFGYLFLLFAFLLWPTYIPLAVLSFETDQRKRWCMKILALLGVSITTYLLVMLILIPLHVTAPCCSIQYSIDVPGIHIITGLYLLVVSGTGLLSSRPWVRWFGLATLVSATVSAAIWYQTFTSTWCFFAALLSVLVYLELRDIAYRSDNVISTNE